MRLWTYPLCKLNALAPAAGVKYRGIRPPLRSTYRELRVGGVGG